MGFLQPNDQGADKVSVTLSLDMWNFIRCGLKDCIERLEADMAEEANPVDKEDLRVLIEENQDVIDMITKQVEREG